MLIAMQRRPLEPIPFDEDDILTPFDRLAILFGKKSKENSDVLCVQPLIYSENYNRLFEMIGFIETPVHPKVRKKNLYPEVAPEDEHPTGFLQYGAEIRRKNHVIFEIGDYSRLVRFDFKENYREGDDQLFYQLDELQIWDGGTRFDLNCEDVNYQPYISLSSRIISNCVQFMSKGLYSDAKESFASLDDLIRNLNDLSDRFENQRAEEWLQAQTQAQQNTNTP